MVVLILVVVAGTSPLQKTVHDLVVALFVFILAAVLGLILVLVLLLVADE